MSELGESELSEILEDLISEENLKLNGNEYFYISNKKPKRTRKIEIDKIPIPRFHIDDLLTDEYERHIYNNLPQKLQDKVYRYIVVIKNAGGNNKLALNTFLVEFGKRYPKYKIPSSTFHRLNRLYQKEGLQGIIPKHRSRNFEIPPYKNQPVETSTCDNKFELKEMIAKVKNSDLYMPVLLVASLGLKPEEIEPLYWNDINIENSEINIDKIMVNGEIIKYNTEPPRRICKMPPTLCTILKEEKEKIIRIFGCITDKKLQAITNEEGLTFEILRSNYIKDLINHQIPLDIISKRLGFCNVDDFMKDYGNLVNETFIDTYDPLAM